jgi:hypothetical protein
MPTGGTMALDLRFEILKSLRASPIVVRQLVRGLDDFQIRYRPTPKDWAVIEVVAHLADTDQRALERVQRMLHEEEPYLPAYDPNELARECAYINMNLGEQLDRYEQERRRHVADLEALDPAAWERIGRHEAHGQMSVELYESHTACEDVDHLAQIARLIALISSMDSAGSWAATSDMSNKPA